MTTYSAISRLPLMTPGDPAVKDSWGLVINSAWPCIEQTAAGVATIGLTGITSLTLSVANDAPDQARNAMLLFTGQPTAQCTVTIPSVARIGWVSNQSNQTVILATATASTNLSIPPGASFLYICDGAAVSSVSIGGVGVLNASAGVSIGNGSVIAANDSGGTLRPLLSLGFDNWTNLFLGGTIGWRVLNQGGSAVLFTILPNGNTTINGGLTTTGPASIGGTLSVVGATALGTLNISGASTYAGTSTFSGGVIANGFDPGGMQFRTVGGNYGAGWRNDGITFYLLMTPSGQQLAIYNALRPFSVNLATGVVTIDVTAAGAAFGGTLSTGGNITAPSVVAGTGSFFCNNGQGLLIKDNSATYRAVINLGSDNVVNLVSAGANGIRFSNQAGSQLAYMDNAGMMTFTAGNVVVPNALIVSGATSLQATTASTVTASTLTSVGGVSGVTGTFTNATVSGTIAGAISNWSGLLTASASSTFSGTGGITDASGVHGTSGYTVGISILATNGIAAVGFYANSDARLKSEITDITAQDGYDWINRGRPRSYIMDGRARTGFVAQEEIDNGRGDAVVLLPDDRPQFAKSDGYAPAGARLARDYEHDIAFLTAALQGALDRLHAIEDRLATLA